MKTFNFLLVIAILWLPVVAQQLPTTQYSTADILPHNTVRDILITKNGTLWAGTDNGLIKKQNTNIQTFFVEDGLPLNNIWALCEDENKDLWIGTYGNGISHYDGRQFTNISSKEGLIHDEITHLFTSENLIYVGTSDGISIVNVASKKVMGSLKYKSENLMRVSGFFEFANKIYATTYNTGVFEIGFANNQISLDKISNHTFIYSAFKKGDSLYASNKKYVSVFAIQDLVNKNNVSPVDLNDLSVIWDYSATKNGKLYAAAWGIFEDDGGLIAINKNGTQTIASEIPSNQVLSLTYSETFDRLYIGTKDQGLFQLDLSPSIVFQPKNHETTI